MAASPKEIASHLDKQQKTIDSLKAKVASRDEAVRQRSRCPKEEQTQHDRPAGCQRCHEPERRVNERLHLDDEKEQQPVNPDEHGCVTDLITSPRGKRETPGPHVNELQHTAETKPEEQRSGDCE